MNIWIEKVILWPKNHDFNPRIIAFENNRINVVYGDSRTGKSALIPIIDYCLCSSDYRVPVDIIRDNTEWYGVLLHCDKNEILLCRAEAGKNKQTSHMYYAVGKKLTIPKFITENTTSENIKDLLNQQFGFTDLPIADQGAWKTERPSFRDIAAFLYQPQNIIANPEALFYKLDKLEHKQKLASIFPYLAGAITSRDLVNELELEEVKKRLARLQNEVKALKNVSASWKMSAKGKITRACELGVSTFDPDLTEDFDDLLKEIERISQLNHSDILETVSEAGAASEKIAQLSSIEADLSMEKADLIRRLEKIDKALLSYDQMEETLDSLTDYIGITEWLLHRVSEEEACPICGQQLREGHKELESLQALSLEINSEASASQIKLGFDKERKTLLSKIQTASDELNAVSSELRALEEEQSSTRFTLSEIERFIGELRASLKQFKAIFRDTEAESKIEALLKRQNELETLLSAANTAQKLHQAIEDIAAYTKFGLKSLDVEHDDWKTVFDYKNLSLEIIDNEGSIRLLSEIGSASNWLSYHIAFSLALQKYLQANSPLSIPSFIFYDQPSQVYFPHAHEINENIGHADSENIEADRDRAAVKKIFASFDKFLKEDDFDFQIIVTEHAGKDIWGEFRSIYEVEHWETDGEKLIPNKWLDFEE